MFVVLFCTHVELRTFLEDWKFEIPIKSHVVHKLYFFAHFQNNLAGLDFLELFTYEKRIRVEIKNGP